MILAMNIDVYSTFQSAGGLLRGRLRSGHDIISGTLAEEPTNNDLLRVRVKAARWSQLGGQLGDTLRMVWPEGRVTEHRVVSAQMDETSNTIDLEALPLWAELSLHGAILQRVAGEVVTKLTGAYMISAAVAQFVIPHRSATLFNIVLGSIENDEVVDFDLDLPTPAAVLLRITEQKGHEWELVRTDDTTWTLNGVRSRGSSAVRRSIRTGINQLALHTGLSRESVSSVVQPFGDQTDSGNRASMATARYEVAAFSGMWVRLIDPATGRSPIRFDGQWLNAQLRTRFGFSQIILDSSAATESVLLGALAGLEIGSRVQLYANDDEPLTTIYDETSLAQHDELIYPLVLAGVRGEANELRNGRFRLGLESWREVNVTTPPSMVEVRRSELDKTVSALAKGARAAGTSTATLFTMDGVVADTTMVRRGDRMLVGGAVMDVNAPAVPSTLGALSLSVASPGLPGDVADDTAVILQRQDTRTFYLDGAQSPLSFWLRFKDTNTDNLGILASASPIGSATSGAYTGSVLQTGYDADNGGYTRALAGKARLAFGAPSTLTWATFATDTHTVSISAFTYLSASSARITVSSGVLSVGSRIRVYTAAGRFVVVAVTAVSGATADVTVESEATLPFWGSSAGAFLPGLACDLMLADNSAWTVNLRREDRTLRFSGAHTAGDTSLDFKAISAIARRDWTTSDTVEIARDITATMDVTGYTIDTTFDEEGNATGLVMTATFDTGTSTIDSVDPADYAYPREAWFIFTGGTPWPWRLLDVTAGVATLVCVTVPIGGTVSTGMVSASWTVFDSYPVTTGDTWGSDGRATLGVAAIPSGRSYARGQVVWSNWHTRAVNSYGQSQLRLHTALNASDTTIELYGNDTWNNITGEGAVAPCALYQVWDSASQIPIAGNELFADETTQANSLGELSVKLKSANLNAVLDNAPVTITRPAMVPVDAPQDGSVVRLLYPVGGSNQPNSSTPGLESVPVLPITVPTGASRVVTVLVTVSLSTGTYPLGQLPAMALVNSAGTILEWGRLADGAVQVMSTPTTARMVMTHTLLSSTSVAVRVYGGATDWKLWQTLLDTMLVEMIVTDVPFHETSWANDIVDRGLDVHAERREAIADLAIGVAIPVRWFDRAADLPVPVVGQSVMIEEYQVVRRLRRVTRDVVNTLNITVEVGIVPTPQSQRVASLLSRN